MIVLLSFIISSHFYPFPCLTREMSQKVNRLSTLTLHRSIAVIGDQRKHNLWLIWVWSVAYVYTLYINAACGRKSKAWFWTFDNKSITWGLTEWKRRVSLYFYHCQTWISGFNPCFHKVRIYIARWMPCRYRYTIASPVSRQRPYRYLIHHIGITRCIHVRYAWIAYTQCILRCWNRTWEGESCDGGGIPVSSYNKSSQRLPNTPVCQHQWMPC